MKIDHVTAIVDDLAGVSAALARLFDSHPTVDVEFPGMQVRTFELEEHELHLVAPTAPGAVQDFLQSNGPALHHLALAVDDIDEAIRAYQAKGIACQGPPIQTAPGVREVFLDPAHTGGLMIQLVERSGVAGEQVLDGARVLQLAQQSAVQNN